MIASVAQLSDEALNFLRQTLGADNVSVTNADRAYHARDQSFHHAHMPAAIVFPETPRR